MIASPVATGVSQAIPARMPAETLRQIAAMLTQAGAVPPQSANQLVVIDLSSAREPMVGYLQRITVGRHIDTALDAATRAAESTFSGTYTVRSVSAADSDALADHIIYVETTPEGDIDSQLDAERMFYRAYRRELGADRPPVEVILRMNVASAV